MLSTGKFVKSEVYTTQCSTLKPSNHLKIKDMRFTKQDSVSRISNLPSKFYLSSNVLLMLWRKGTWTGGGGMVDWGEGTYGGWGAPRLCS
jgi:hypothetical protein